MNASITPVSFDMNGAAAASGVSRDVIARAIKAGDLPVTYPRINGQPIAKPLIHRDALDQWVRHGATERKAS